MLAHRFKEHRKKLQYPLFVQPKLNGVRMLHRNGLSQSRYEEEWNPPVLAHISDQLRHISRDIIFDGELYVHGWSLQQINSACAVKRIQPTDKTRQLEYHIFDCIVPDQLNMPFVERTALLQSLLFNSPQHNLRFVETHLILTELDAEVRYAQFRASFYEGMMYRHRDAPYGFAEQCGNKENRWTTLIKRKDFLEDDFVCVDWTPGRDGFEGLVGALVFEMPNGQRFNAGSGLDLQQRQEFILRSPVGLRCRVKYEMLSDTGVPLKPIIEAVDI